MNRQQAKEIAMAMAGICRTDWEALKRDVEMQFGRKAMSCTFQPEGDEGKPVMGWPGEAAWLKQAEDVPGWDAYMAPNGAVRYGCEKNKCFQIKKTWSQTQGGVWKRVWTATYWNEPITSISEGETPGEVGREMYRYAMTGEPLPNGEDVPIRDLA